MIVSEHIAAWIFWICVSVVVYTYFGYPFLLILLERIAYRPVHKSRVFPEVSVIITAYNEEDTIRRKLLNVLSGNYPHEKLEVIVASDGSTDSTNAIVEQFAERGVKLLAYPTRRGKASVINDSIKAARGEIVILADARQLFDEDAIEELVANFADPTIGVASGEMGFRQGTTGVGQAAGLYWRYEVFLRTKESAIHSSAGATGAMLALRKELFQELPPNTIVDDVRIPLDIVPKGYRVVIDKDAKFWDVAATSTSEDMARRTRTLAGIWQLLFDFRFMLTVVLGPIGFQYISHKVFRLLCPFALCGALVSNIRLGTPFYRDLLVLQACFYCSAIATQLLGGVFHKSKLLRLPWVFCTANVSIVAGLLQLLGRRSGPTWKKARIATGEGTLGRVAAIAADVLIFNTGIVIAFEVRFLGVPPIENFAAYREVLLLFLLVPPIVFYVSDIYQKKCSLLLPEDSLDVLRATAVTVAVCTVILFALRTRTAAFPTTVLFLSVFVNGFLLVGWRWIARRVAITFAQYEEPMRVLLVSDQRICSETLQMVKSAYRQPIAVVGFVGNAGSGVPDMVQLDNMEGLSSATKRHQVEEVVMLGEDAIASEETLRLAYEWDGERVGLKVLLLPEQAVFGKLELEMVGDMPLLAAKPPSIAGTKFVFKGLVDFLFAIPCVIIATPIILALLAYVWMIRRKPVKLAIRRAWGQGATRVWALRLIDKQSPAASIETGSQGSSDLSVRIVNKLFLLLNVIKGELSLVGPDLSFDRAGEAEVSARGHYLPIKPGLVWVDPLRQDVAMAAGHELASAALYALKYSPLSDLAMLRRSISSSELSQRT